MADRRNIEFEKAPDGEWRARFKDGVELADWETRPTMDAYLSGAIEDGWAAEEYMTPDKDVANQRAVVRFVRRK